LFVDTFAPKLACDHNTIHGYFGLNFFSILIVISKITAELLALTGQHDRTSSILTVMKHSFFRSNIGGSVSFLLVSQNLLYYN